MIFDSSLKKKFLSTLAIKLPPFDRFVSKIDLEETDSGVKSKDKLITEIAQQMKNTPHSLLIPVIGDTGSGKTHFLWELKNSIDIDQFTAFINVPHSREKFFYNIYSHIIQAFGSERVKEFTQQFGERFGATERLYGFFRTQDIAKISLNAFEQLKDKFENLSALQQCIIVLVQHFLKRDTFDVTERWLLGQLMEMDELFMINVNEDLSGKGLAETMLKLLIEFYEQGIILLFDDFGKSAVEFDKLADMSDMKEVNWAEDIEIDSPTENNQKPDDLQTILTKIIKKMNSFKIIITLDQENAENILTGLREKLDSKYISEPIFLPAFSLEDSYFLYLSRIREFCWNYNLKHPAADREFDIKRDLDLYYSKIGDDLYFPLNAEILKYIHEYSKGNARTYLRNLKRISDAIIFEELKLENLNADYKKYIKYS